MFAQNTDTYKIMLKQKVLNCCLEYLGTELCIFLSTTTISGFVLETIELLIKIHA